MNPLNHPPHEIIFTETKKEKHFALGQRKALSPEDTIHKAHKLFAEQFTSSKEGLRAKEIYKVKKDAVKAFDTYLEQRSNLRKFVDKICSFFHFNSKTSLLENKKNEILNAYDPGLEKDFKYHEYNGKEKNTNRYFRDLKKDWGHFLLSEVNSNDLPERFRTMFEKKYSFEALLKKAPSATPDELLKLLAIVSKDPESKALAFYLLSKAAKSPDFKNAIRSNEAKGVEILLSSRDPMKKALAIDALKQLDFLPFNKEWLKHLSKEELLFEKLFGKNLVQRDPIYLSELQSELERLNQSNAIQFFEEMKNPLKRKEILERKDIEEFPLVAHLVLKGEINANKGQVPQDLNQIARILNKAVQFNDVDSSVFEAIVPHLEKNKIELANDWKELYDTLLKNKGDERNINFIRLFAFIVKDPSEDFLKEQLYAAARSKTAPIEALQYLFTNFPIMREPNILFQEVKHLDEFFKWAFNNNHFSESEKQALFSKVFFSNNLIALEFCRQNDPKFGEKLENLQNNQFLKSSPEAVQLMFFNYVARSESDQFNVLKDITGETDRSDMAKALLKTGKNRLFQLIFPLLSKAEKTRLLSVDHGDQNAFLVENYAKDIPENTPLARGVKVH